MTRPRRISEQQRLSAKRARLHVEWSAVLMLLGLLATPAAALTPTVTPIPTVSDCSAVCSGQPCIAGPVFRPGTCVPSGESCQCVPVTPGPGECDLACDGRPCTSHCPDGSVASGFCTILTVDTGCACSPDCPSPCVGDCDRHGEVTVDELVTLVNIALGNNAVATCAAGDADGDGAVTITEIIAAVARALNGCVVVSPTPTPDPLERESGDCYESSECFPVDAYPFRPFPTNRAYCCHLSRTTGGTFSWCPIDMFDPSSLVCSQCIFPCK